MTFLDERTTCPLCHHDVTAHVTLAQLGTFTEELLCIVLGCNCTWPQPNPYAHEDD